MTIKFISENHSGVIYVENEKGEVFGIVSASEILDCDGLVYGDDTLSVIEHNFQCGIDQDWENERTEINTDCGNVIVFSGSQVWIEYRLLKEKRK